MHARAARRCVGPLPQWRSPCTSVAAQSVCRESIHPPRSCKATLHPRACDPGVRAFVTRHAPLDCGHRHYARAHARTRARPQNGYGHAHVPQRRARSQAGVRLENANRLKHSWASAGFILLPLLSSLPKLAASSDEYWVSASLSSAIWSGGRGREPRNGGR